MNRGGIETWLMQVLRQPGAAVQYELLLLSFQVGDYEPELAALGVRVHRCPPPNSPAFVRCVLDVLRRGHYDVVHSHVHHFSGAVLALARLSGVPGRLAHSHLDSRVLDRAARWPRKLYLRLMTALIAAHASEGVAVSDQAAAALFGPQWRRKPERRVVPLGIDPQPYTVPVDVQALRQSLDLPGEALVIGHVGWFRTQKNHAFLLRVFAEIWRRRPDARLLLVGGGELMDQVRLQALELGVLEAVVFAGSRSDVPALLRVMDVFVFPSLHEGLGLAVIEAQMVGLACVHTAGLPPESRLPGTDVTALPLDAGAPAWADAVLEAAGRSRQYPSAQPYDLAHSTALFLERYDHYRR